MKLTFILALLAAVSLAEKDTTADFMQFAVQQSKSYKSIEEFQKRKETFEKNHQFISALNLKHEGSNVQFGHNFTSDLTDDEFKVMLGLSTYEVGKETVSLLDDTTDAEGRHLQTNSNVDWVAAGKIHDVKNQGNCCSSWAFAAATALEGVQAIKDGPWPIRLSEQQAIDCTSGSCANGGETAWAWDFWAGSGAMSNGDYNYTAKDGQSCRRWNDRPIVWPAEHGQITGSTSNVVTQLQQGPMTVAVGGDNDCWRFYSSGILSMSDGCPIGTSHAVALVAYTAGATSDVCTTTSVWNCDDCDFCHKADCTPRQGGDDFESLHGPGRADFNLWVDCCVWETVTNCTSVTTPSFWTIQNSWGTGWGEKGFMHIEVTEGWGVSGINTIVQWVTVV